MNVDVVTSYLNFRRASEDYTRIRQDVKLIDISLLTRVKCGSAFSSLSSEGNLIVRQYYGEHSIITHLPVR
jgi:hypothetical protein